MENPIFTEGNFVVMRTQLNQPHHQWIKMCVIGVNTIGAIKYKVRWLNSKGFMCENVLFEYEIASFQ